MQGKTRLHSIAVVAIVAILCLATVGLLKILTTPAVREIAPAKAKRMFKMITGSAIAEPAEDLRAIFWDSRDPSIFVRFRTNADGIAYMMRTFGGPDATSSALNIDALKRQEESGWRPFWQLDAAEKKWGIPHLFDAGQLKSAVWLTRMDNVAPGSHDTFHEQHILIDTENGTVYMWAISIG